MIKIGSANPEIFEFLFFIIKFFYFDILKFILKISKIQIYFDVFTYLILYFIINYKLIVRKIKIFKFIIKNQILNIFMITLNGSYKSFMIIFSGTLNGDPIFGLQKLVYFLRTYKIIQII